MSEEFGSSYLERAWEAPEEVVLRRELVRTPGLQPEDVGVLAELLLRDPRLPSTMEAIRQDLQAQGWKMGKDRYTAIAGRLTNAGHLARVSVYDEAAKRPTWVTRVYRNPANNEQYVDLGITASMQVRAEVRETRDSGTSELRVTRASPGHSRTAENPQSGSELRETRDSETDVSPGHGRNAETPRSDVHPPHPPEEVETSSPYPLKSADRAKEGEGASSASNDEKLQAAYDFLQELPNPWRAGRATARKLAPKLIEAIAEQGWELDADLAKKLTEAPEGIKSYPSVLARRVDDLPRRGPSRLPGQRRERLSNVPERPASIVPSEDGMAAVRAAFEAIRSGTR
ncbi:hypothetical protein [Streptomyces lateritius]|uniref:hypothetical protein n=1 Tax=Streptomyces lateritius TaxID=67313 RepID=UPI001675D74F|nr:hypothetical protein [Streptomyces lateritius]GGU11394.1 hypothetical protein GCM10010272_65770 [Streptomyces lateritius]